MIQHYACATATHESRKSASSVLLSWTEITKYPDQTDRLLKIIQLLSHSAVDRAMWNQIFTEASDFDSSVMTT